jgi:hypothetical protein
MEITDADLVQRLRALRTHIDLLATEAAAIAAPFEEAKKTIEAVMLARLNERHAKNSRTEYGTFYKEDIMSTKVVDKVKFLDHVFALRSNGAMSAYDLLTQAVSKDSIATYIEASGGHPPPGVEVEYFVKIKVRKN